MSTKSKISNSNITNNTTTTSTTNNNNNNITSTCKHIINYKNDGGSNKFNIIENYIYSVKMKLVDSSKLPTPYCMVCHNFNGRIHICLHCVHFSCWKSGHIQQHFNDTNNEHFLAVDLNLNQIYCNHCKDYIYDKEFDEIKEMVKLNIHDVKNPSSKRIKYKSWKPSYEEFQFIKKNSDVSIDYSNPIIGLRGLNNLGNTCFMNSILQSYIHNPLLRNYFLSDMHKCEKKKNNNNNNNNINNNVNCNNIDNNNNVYIKQEPNEINEEQSLTPTSTTSSSSQLENNNSKICLGCEMDKLYTQIFSGLKIPFTPHHFLYSCWNYSSYFVGYEQQDAHEFFISSLNGIHSHCGGTTGKDCNCIVHCTFGGSLKSDITCLNCQYISSTSDPFIDISLDLPKSRDLNNNSNNGSTKTTPTKYDSNNNNNNNNNNNEDDTNSEDQNISSNNNIGNGNINGHHHHHRHHHRHHHHHHQPNTLLACLDRFTQPEKLDEKYFCSNCNCRQESTKQLSFDVLPVVICFHLKRFEQSKTNRRTHKIDTFVEFPITIDMTPYTTLARNKNKSIIKNNNINSKKRKNRSDENDENNSGTETEVINLIDDNDNDSVAIEDKKEDQKEVSNNDSNNNNSNNNSSSFEFLNDQEQFPSIITDENDNSFIYELFAVVNHTGKIDSGHYTCFVKHHDNWYKCDDSMISSTTIHNVLKSKGYLLYYLKKQLEYSK